MGAGGVDGVRVLRLGCIAAGGGSWRTGSAGITRGSLGLMTRLSAGVVTITSGRETLERCVESVRGQTYPCRQYIFADGVIDLNAFLQLEWKYASEETYVSWWSARAGGKDLEGRRLLAAAGMMVKDEVLFVLNDDDWYEPDHVESLMEIINGGCDWAYSFRKIFDEKGKFLFDDECESLGEEHPCWNIPDENFAETCSIAMRTEKFRNLAVLYTVPGYGPDRVFYQHAKSLYPRFRGSRKHTMCFRLGGNPGSVQREYFEHGHRWMKEKYPAGMPWK